MLFRSGYLTAQGHLRSQALLKALSAFWQSLFTGSAPMVPVGLASYQYISALVHGNRNHHYLKHAVLMAFVSRSPAEFFSIEEPHVMPVPASSPSDRQAAEQAVLRLLAEQTPMRQIARQTGYSVGYIKQLALRHHQPVDHRAKRITVEVERGIWRQAFMGGARQQIAHSHGVSVGAVEAILQSHQGLSDWRRHLRRVNRLREHRVTVAAYLAQHADVSRGCVEPHLLGSINMIVPGCINSYLPPSEQFTIPVWIGKNGIGNWLSNWGCWPSRQALYLHWNGQSIGQTA